MKFKEFNAENISAIKANLVKKERVTLKRFLLYLKNTNTNQLYR